PPPQRRGPPVAPEAAPAARGRPLRRDVRRPLRRPPGSHPCPRRCRLREGQRGRKGFYAPVGARGVRVDWRRWSEYAADVAHVLHFSRQELFEMDLEELATWHAEAMRVVREMNGIRGS
ncbi:MAG: GpE family phage tail protein, partial [Devosia sp.]|nr:GpE family phage tail protein [Devosia sp.]